VCATGRKHEWRSGRTGKIKGRTLDFGTGNVMQGTQMMEVEWRKLRADELRDAAMQDAIVILPVASVEQHGPHLPVETDTAIGEAVTAGTARRLMERGERAVVLPAMWFGLSEHHMPFGGTITLGLPAFQAVIEDICRSLQRHGFRRIVLSNSHGGNENALRAITDDLTVRLRLPIILFTYVPVAAQAVAPLLTTQSDIYHACEAETAMMLALRPELVARDRIPARFDLPTSGGPSLYRWRSFAVRTETGVMGNPAAGTAEQGQKMLDAIADKLAEKLAYPALWEAQIFPASSADFR
jgi:creatinine amidohydrolase